MSSETHSVTGLDMETRASMDSKKHRVVPNRYYLSSIVQVVPNYLKQCNIIIWFCIKSYETEILTYLCNLPSHCDNAKHQGYITSLHGIDYLWWAKEETILVLVEVEYLHGSMISKCVMVQLTLWMTKIRRSQWTSANRICLSSSVRDTNL